MNSTLRNMWQRLNWIIFPGINLHSRLRYAILPENFLATRGDQIGYVLDAGSGNGMLAYQSYRKGNRVLAISFKRDEVTKSRKLFNEFLRIPEDRLTFREGNLYDLDLPSGIFDEIVCTEVIEHIKDDVRICRRFYDLLKPGGYLHLTAPNADHAYNAAVPLDTAESGGHVRSGYTVETYRKLLEPIGFEILFATGLGGPIRQAFNRRIKEIQQRYGRWAGVPLFLIALPFLPLDKMIERHFNPISLYVKAFKLPKPGANPLNGAAAETAQSG